MIKRHSLAVSSWNGKFGMCRDLAGERIFLTSKAVVGSGLDPKQMKTGLIMVAEVADYSKGRKKAVSKILQCRPPVSSDRGP